LRQANKTAGVLNGRKKKVPWFEKEHLLITVILLPAIGFKFVPPIRYVVPFRTSET
jgi:hypothetical protein